MTIPHEPATRPLAQEGAQFLDWLDGRLRDLAPLDLQSYMQSNNISPDRIAVVSVDMIEGFCCEGPLASPRIAGVTEAVAELFRRAHRLGVRQFALVQEYHTADAPEFEQFAPHGIRDTEEARTIEQLRELPFAGLFNIVLKNSIHPALNTSFDQWLTDNPQTNTFITVGDCTDLCLYQTAMYLKLRGNAMNSRTTVIVPEDCVQTYDLPIELAGQIGALPHNGDLLHAVFLYSMALNGVQVVREVV